MLVNARFMKNKQVLIRVYTTLIGWVCAFFIAYLMLFFWGKELESLPIALNALIFTGVLVPIMGNVVMPFVGKQVAKFVEKQIHERKEEI